MTPDDRTLIEGAVAALTEAMGDSGQLVVEDVVESEVRLRLVLDDAACEDCVLPAEHIAGLAKRAIDKAAGDNRFEVVLDDSRRA